MILSFRKHLINFIIYVLHLKSLHKYKVNVARHLILLLLIFLPAYMNWRYNFIFVKFQQNYLTYTKIFDNIDVT